MTEREKIAAKIRALMAKTVENGCTEDEAIAAAAMVAKLRLNCELPLSKINFIPLFDAERVRRIQEFAGQCCRDLQEQFGESFDNGYQEGVGKADTVSLNRAMSGQTAQRKRLR